MVTPETIEYVRKLRERGFTEDQLIDALKQTNWSETDIHEIMESIKTKNAPSESYNPNPSEASHTTMTSQNLELTSDISTPGVSEVINEASKRKTKKPLLLSLVAIFVVLLAAMAALAYAYYRQQPAFVLARMVKKLPMITTVSYNGEITTKSTSATANSGDNYKVTLNGKVDTSNAEVPKNQLLVQLVASGSANSSKDSVGLEFRSIKDIVYFQLISLQSSELDFLREYSNKWIKVDEMELRNAYEEASALAPSMGTPMTTPTEEIFTKEQIQQIVDLAKRTSFIEFSKNLGNSTISGVPVYHYHYKINETNTKNFVLQAIKIGINRDLTQEEKDDVLKELNSVSMPTGEIWIGRKDSLPYKLTADFVATGRGGDSSETLSIMFNFQGYNKPVEIEAPKNSTSLMEILKPYIDLYTSMSNSSGNSAIDTDKDGLSDSMEALFGTDPLKRDTDGNGKTDYEDAMSNL